MKLKRLQHAADTLCQMFCGWRLINSLGELERLGSGTLRIDAISGGCHFNGHPIDELSIAGELSQWLKDDLSKHEIPIELLVRADLVANIDLQQVKRKTRFGDRLGDLDNRFHISCESEVVTDNKIYASSKNDLEEWPVGWPSA